MADDLIHYEIFGCRASGEKWTLEAATEDRRVAVEIARDLVGHDGFAAARVTMETLDERTRIFSSVPVLKLGSRDPAVVSRADPRRVAEQYRQRSAHLHLCTKPEELYSPQARERIGRLLDRWLELTRATPFELLHRAELARKLAGSGYELQHAIQKIVVPIAVARECSSHDLIRGLQSLYNRALERLEVAQRGGSLADLAYEPFAAAAERLAGDGDGRFRLAAGIAAAIAPARTWSDKLDRLLDLAEAAPPAGPARDFALSVLQEPLSEILAMRAARADLFGRELDLGGELVAIARLIAAPAVDRLVEEEPSVAQVIPPTCPIARRVAAWLETDAFSSIRNALRDRVFAELGGPRRLRPGDALGEIEILRALARILTAAASERMPLEDVRAALSVRSKMLLAGDFVDAYLGRGHSAYEEAQALVFLAQNVVGIGNKRDASRWLSGLIGSLRFETDLVRGEEPAAQRLGCLADLQRAAGRCDLVNEDARRIHTHLGELGGRLEADARLVASLTRSSAPVLNRLHALLKLAMGETAPLGPAAERARTAALRLLRDGKHPELAGVADQMAAVLQSPGRAA